MVSKHLYPYFFDYFSTRVVSKTKLGPIVCLACNSTDNGLWEVCNCRPVIITCPIRNHIYLQSGHVKELQND